ncbi:MAG: molybdopterin-dependent oxidoreductase [Persicimonas sp.]
MDIQKILTSMLGMSPAAEAPTSSEQTAGPPEYAEVDPASVEMIEVEQRDGRLNQYPPPERWDDWAEWDGREWPRRVARNYTLVPTICFNCESGCGLLAYVDKKTYEIRKLEGNPAHPGSRGRNCAKGPATHNQVYDPERILHPLKRVGERGAGKWKRISWEEALSEISEKMGESLERRKDGIMYHVGRPGDDGYANRVVQSWGVDGHNSHTNICSSGARCGYWFWGAFDRPSPDHANAKVILLISSHLETGHYFNPHAQRIIEGMESGAKLINFDPRVSNTASKSDVWLSTWPGSEMSVLLAMANYLIQEDRYDRTFVRDWVNWKEFLAEGTDHIDSPRAREVIDQAREDGELDAPSFELFDRVLKALYSEFTFERAAAEAQVSADKIREAAELVADCQGRLATHTWRSASIGNEGGWQVARCLFFLNVLTGSVGTKGGTSFNSWNKFKPKAFSEPEPNNVWNELEYPQEFPLAFFEMSFLLPHLLEEGRGDVDVYFSRVYNPLWINPDGFTWLEALRDKEKIKCHVALTPTWNESAWFADYVLPMGLAPERHDLQSQETHAGQWLAFRQPVRRVAMERAGKDVQYTYEANPGEVWEEAEFWIELSGRLDPDGERGIRKHFESPYRDGELVTVEEYFRWMFENSVPGLPEAAEQEGLTPLEYMRKYGAFEVVSDYYEPYREVVPDERVAEVDDFGRAFDASGEQIGVRVDGAVREAFGTPSGKLEFFAPTLAEWGWPEQEYVIPWTLDSHVHPSNIDIDSDEMLLLPNFRLPTLIHTRSANAKWLYEISHKNPIWMNPIDAERIGVDNNALVRVTTEIGYMVDRVWITEAIKPGIIAMSHHLGRWRLEQDQGGNKGTSAVAKLEEDDEGGFGLNILQGAQAWKSWDPDTERIWWEDVGVHQNLTHPVHPDPISGAHCWLQKCFDVCPAKPGDKHGDVWVDTKKSMEVYRQWMAKTRPAKEHSPDGTRRPYWLKRPLKPTREAYKFPDDDGVAEGENA